MRIDRVTVAQALESLRSSPGGLSQVEAARRLVEYGPNRVEEVARTPLWLRAARQFTHFFALILLLAAGLAFLADAHDPGQGMAALGWAILGVVVVNGAFAFWQEERAERAVEALKGLLPHEATVRRDGVAVRIATGLLVPGDVILLQEGDDVPADCRVLEAAGVRVNLATVTGESLPKTRRSGPSDEGDVLHSRNVLLAGTTIVSGSAVALVFATGMRTEFGRIAHLTQSAPDRPSPLQLEISRLSKLIAVLAAALGIVFFVIGWALGLGFWTNLLFAIGILVANVPEGLLPTVTLALAMATQRMARRNALIRHLPAAESLGSATVILTDKTGTLTENRMRAVKAYVAGGRDELTELPEVEAGLPRPFVAVARNCHSLRRVERNGAFILAGDPMEVALVEMAERAAGAEPPRLDELAFDADRKCMSTVHGNPAERALYCKGALEKVLPLYSHVLLPGCPGPGAWQIAPLAESGRHDFLAAQDRMAEQGLRVLALAFRSLPEGVPREEWETGLGLVGLVGLQDPPRPEVPGAVATCLAAGIRVIMVTGDHPHTARAVARDVGLAASPVTITGDVLEQLSDTELQLALDGEVLFARATAGQKLRIVDALQRKGHVVAVTGDGVNDAPALKRADIGIAMGVVGTDVARGAADMVLLDDNFASIVAAIEEGRAVFQNIRKFLTYILTSNVPEIVPYLAFVLARIPLPLTIVQILAVDLGTDMFPALALGAEKPVAGTMSQPPRRRDQRLIDWPLLARAYLWLGPLAAVAAMAAFFFVLERAGWEYGQRLGSGDPLYLRATTACLVAIVMSQVANVFTCRHPRLSAFSFPLFGNPHLLWGIAAEIGLILAIVYTRWGNLAFGTARVGAAVWLFAASFGAAVLAAEELRKAVARRVLGLTSSSG